MKNEFDLRTEKKSAIPKACNAPRRLYLGSIPHLRAPFDGLGLDFGTCSVTYIGTGTGAELTV